MKAVPQKKQISKKHSIEECKRVISLLYKEIERKDKMIDSLREENKILLKTAFRNAEDKIETEKLEKK